MKKEDDAIEKFYREGGTFSKYELEHLNFSRLKNDDFILNKQIEPENLFDFEKNE